MKIRIDKCTDGNAWYANRVGHILDVEWTEANRSPGQGIPEDVYWCREGGIYNPINYVRKSDATELSTTLDQSLPAATVGVKPTESQNMMQCRPLTDAELCASLRGEADDWDNVLRVVMEADLEPKPKDFLLCGTLREAANRIEQKEGRDAAIAAALDDLKQIQTFAHRIAIAGPAITPTLQDAWPKFDHIAIMATSAIAQLRVHGRHDGKGQTST